MLINHYQHLERYEGETFGPHLVLRGAKERIVPILMTALSTGPSVGAPRASRQHCGSRGRAPDGDRYHWGALVTSTLLNLFVVPSLYLQFGKSSVERELIAADA